MIDIAAITFDTDTDSYGNTGLCLDLTVGGLGEEVVDQLGGGRDHGGIALRFLVDGQRNQLLIADGHTAPRQSIAYAIDVLTKAIKEMDRIPDQRAGRCLTVGEWGRCSSVCHVGPHTFPTQADAAALR